jgi:hypothetical protein
MTALTIAQKLALTKWLTDRLAALRKDDLLPEAQAELVAGERAAVKFGGDVAAWISMPQPTTTVSVTDEGKLLAWAQENAPHAVETVTEVAVTGELIRYLRQNAPEFLAERQRVAPDWAEDAKTGLKAKGFYVTWQGEKVPEVPGITVSSGESVPRVTLTSDASLVIGRAWQNGDIGLSGLMELPAGETA